MNAQPPRADIGAFSHIIPYDWSYKQDSGSPRAHAPARPRPHAARPLEPAREPWEELPENGRQARGAELSRALREWEGRRGELAEDWANLAEYTGRLDAEGRRRIDEIYGEAVGDCDHAISALRLALEELWED